jgi:hypothetical protein
VPYRFKISPYLNVDAQVLELDWNFWIVTYEGSSNSGGKPIENVEFIDEVGTRMK